MTWFAHVLTWGHGHQLTQGEILKRNLFQVKLNRILKDLKLKFNNLYDQVSYPSTFWLGGIGLIVYHRGLEYEHFNYTLL